MKNTFCATGAQIKTYKLKDGSSYIVRKAGEEDLGPLMKLMLTVAKEDELSPLTFEEARLQILNSKDKLLDVLLARNPHFFYLVGEVKGKIISFCDIHLGTTKRNRHTAEFGRSVQREFRRSGAGKILQQVAIQKMRELGYIEKITLSISSDNISSVESCKSNGFKLESIDKKKLRICENNYQDLLSYVLYL